MKSGSNSFDISQDKENDLESCGTLSTKEFEKSIKENLKKNIRREDTNESLSQYNWPSTLGTLLDSPTTKAPT